LPHNFVNSSLSGINNSGVALGDACDPSKPCDFFEVNQQGQFQFLKIPAYDAVPLGLNDLNEIVGYYYKPGTTIAAGFLFQNPKAIVLWFPSSIWTVAAAINDAGVVAGYFDDSNGNEHGFVRHASR
jgi:hypothetical protein